MPYVKRYTCLGAMLLLASGIAFAQDKAKGKSIGDSGQVEQTLRNSEKQWVHAQMTKRALPNNAILPNN